MFFNGDILKKVDNLTNIKLLPSGAYILPKTSSSSYWVSQHLPQIGTASAEVYRKSILQQMQYRFAVTFGALSRMALLPVQGPADHSNPEVETN